MIFFALNGNNNNFVLLFAMAIVERAITMRGEAIQKRSHKPIAMYKKRIIKFISTTFAAAKIKEQYGILLVQQKIFLSVSIIYWPGYSMSHREYH